MRKSRMASADEDPEEWGPAMAALNPRQRSFVLALCTNGAKPKQAARTAGYRGGEESLATQGYRMTHSSPRVQAAIIEVCQAGSKEMAPRLLYELHRMATGGAKKEDVKLRAIVAGLAHAGMAPALNVHHEHAHVISYDEKILEIQRLARLVGDDPSEAVKGLAPPVTDVEFEEVE